VRLLRWLGAMVAGALAVSCGTLNVQVSSLDARVIEAELDRRLVRDALPIVLAQTPKALAKQISDLQQVHFNAYVQLGQPYLAAAEASTDAEEKVALQEKASEMQAVFNREVNPFYADVQARGAILNTRIQDLATGAATASETERQRLVAEYTARLRERERLIADLFAIVKDDIGRTVPREIAALEAAADNGRVDRSRASEAIEAVRSGDLAERANKSLIKGQGIVDSPFAYAVASAPECAWKPFNTVYGTGSLGNINVAIKMVDLGDFTLKGLSFDPSDVARTAAKVTTQAVLLSAQIAGVPVSTSGTVQGSGAAMGSSSSRIVDSQKKIVETKTRMKSFQGALDTIAKSILDNTSGLATATPEQRKDIVAAVKATFDAHKGRLVPPAKAKE
jgi:hypothetical protein